MLSLVRFAVVAGVVLVLGGIAAAGSLTTPTLFKGGPASSQNVCIATNVTQTLTLEVTVQMFGILGGFNEQTCTLAPGDPAGCQAFLNDGGYCRITAEGTKAAVLNRFRGVMINRDTNIPFTIFTAVEAR
jgi:hypothetical protein